MSGQDTDADAVPQHCTEDEAGTPLSPPLQHMTDFGKEGNAIGIEKDCTNGTCKGDANENKEGLTEKSESDTQEQEVGLESAEGAQKTDKDKGNEEYQKGNYEEAVKAWNRSLTSVKYIIDKQFYDHNKEQLQEVHAMELRLCLNMAQGYLKTRDWANAITHADKALSRDANNAKALYRKASALMQMLSFNEAAAVLEKLMEVEPKNAAAKSMHAEARRNEQRSERKAK